LRPNFADGPLALNMDMTSPTLRPTGTWALNFRSNTSHDRWATIITSMNTRDGSVMFIRAVAQPSQLALGFLDREEEQDPTAAETEQPILDLNNTRTGLSPATFFTVTDDEFPQGYGDFVFKSIDGVVFHFPLFLLSYVSPVFKDMFAIGEGDQNQEMVTLAEDHATLEYFLRHIDPLKETPPLDWNCLSGALKAAEKYQVPVIFKWFEKEVAVSITATHYPTLPNPMLYFAMARRYELRMTARLALRELIKCPISEVLGNPSVDSSLLKHVINLRGERTQKLIQVIHTTCPAMSIRAIDRCYTHERSYNDHDWKMRVMQAVVTEPSWSAIESSVGKPACGKCVVLGDAKEAREKVDQMENELPALDW
ncbi:1645_t:CDS:2, partial [Acaulospora colombiana]